MESYFKSLAREQVNGKYRSQTTINNYKAAMRSLYKFLTVTAKLSKVKLISKEMLCLKSLLTVLKKHYLQDQRKYQKRYKIII